MSKNKIENLRKKLLEEEKKYKYIISVSAGTCGKAKGADEVIKEFKKEIRKRKLKNVLLKITGCQGFCEIEPTVLILPNDILYKEVNISDVEKIINETILNNKIVEELCFKENGKVIYKEEKIPFFKKQIRLITGNNKFIDPTKIEDYIKIGGYSALVKVLSEIPPEKVIEVIKKSGLRGRGGGGFPTGKKWEYCRKAEGETKFVICNADEGDPGAYMDRSILEGNPHSVIEGMIIGAYAIGSHQGFVYVRNEYPLALKNLSIAIDQARKFEFLGKNILNSGFDFDIEIIRGGGAFVCGESTALMASIEGKIGEPRAKYIHTVERGLYNKPTNLNNVETWANVPIIMNNGWEWYSKIGTDTSKGTKIFSLVGKINNTGLVEVPMGITLREIIEDIGGGIRDGKKFKGVQTGGPSGGVLPESKLDIPVDFDKLTEAGSMMGSGGMIVMDEDTCMVDVAKYFLNFLKEESCGKCVPCREGIRAMLEILERITKGEGKEEDINLLYELANLLQNCSLCALGSTAANPVLTTLNYFKEEYLAHINEKRCPAGVCKALVEYYIDEEKCTGCTACKRICPANAIEGRPKQKHRIIVDKCIKCGACFEVCKFNAVRKK